MLSDIKFEFVRLVFYDWSFEIFIDAQLGIDIEPV
jgi:hypothetical protein